MMIARGNWKRSTITNSSFALVSLLPKGRLIADENGLPDSIPDDDRLYREGQPPVP